MVKSAGNVKSASLTQDGNIEPRKAFNLRFTHQNSPMVTLAYPLLVTLIKLLACTYYYILTGKISQNFKTG